MEHQENERLHVDARAGTGRTEHDLEIAGVDAEIGRGVRGVVSRVRVLLDGKQVEMAMKTYENPLDYQKAKNGFQLVRRSVERERREKGAARSSLLPTVRFDDAGQRIVMTLLGKDGRKVASVYGNSSPGREDLLGSSLPELPNAEEFLDRLFSDVQERGKDRVRMGGDSLLFLAAEDGTLDYVTGDLEGITSMQDPSEAVVGNLVGAAHALEAFFQEAIRNPDACIGPMLKKVRSRVDAWFASQPLANPYKLRRFLDELALMEDGLRKRRGGVGTVIRGMLVRLRDVFGG